MERNLFVLGEQRWPSARIQPLRLQLAPHRLLTESDESQIGANPEGDPPTTTREAEREPRVRRHRQVKC